jgi:quinol monooxygenase YgiN
MIMYVRLVRFSFGPGKEEAIHELAHDLIPAISAQTGCKSALCFGDTSSGEYGLSVQWDSKEHADAASAVIGPRLSHHLAGKVQGQPDIHLFEVIKSAPTT